MPFPPVLSLVTWKKCLTLTLLQPPFRCFWTCSCTSLSCHEGPKTEHRIWGAVPPVSSTGVKPLLLYEGDCGREWSGSRHQLKIRGRKAAPSWDIQFCSRLRILHLKEGFTSLGMVPEIYPQWHQAGAYHSGGATPRPSALAEMKDTVHCPSHYFLLIFQSLYSFLACFSFFPRIDFFLKQSLHIVQISAKSFLKIEVAIYSDVQISQQRLFEYGDQRHEVIEGSSTLSQWLVSILKHKVEQGLTIQWALRTMLPKSLLTVLQSGGWMYASPRPIRTEVSRVCDCAEVISELTTVMSR